MAEIRIQFDDKSVVVITEDEIGTIMGASDGIAQNILLQVANDPEISSWGEKTLVKIVTKVVTTAFDTDADKFETAINVSNPASIN